jgi:exonuclease III
MPVHGKLKIEILAINVNSLNVSTMDSKNSKNLLKIEGITSKKADVIFITDVRAKDKGEELKKLFNMSKNGSYRLYLNSTKESRGVAIAIKRGIFHEIRSTTIDRDNENYILLDVNLKGHNVVLGCIYGPNGNNPNFFKEIRGHLQRIGGNFIVGGDMNTILCEEGSVLNVDRIGEGRTPNVLNSREINVWIREGFAVDPFRAMYPEAQEISYLPFRSRLRGVGGGVNIYSRTRLDFYLISPSLLDGVHRVKYEDRLGTDFDHKGVSLTMGKRDFGGKINIFESTLSDMLSVPSGIMSIYDTINNHPVEQNEAVRVNIVQLDILIREIEMIKVVLGRVGSNEDLEQRRRIAEDNIAIVLNRFPAMEMLMEEAFSCSHKQLYEMIMIGIKKFLSSNTNKEN